MKGKPMRAWAAPVVDGERINTEEVEIATDGITVLPHTLPWPEVAYRYEFAPGEEIPTRPLMVRTTRIDEEITDDRGPLRRAWDWLLGESR